MDQYQKQLLKYGLNEPDYFMEEVLEYELELSGKQNTSQLAIKQEGTILKELDLADGLDEQAIDCLTGGILFGENIEKALTQLGQYDLNLSVVRYYDERHVVRYHYFQDSPNPGGLDWIDHIAAIDLAGNFVLSGEFCELSRGTIAKIIVKNQGKVSGAISMKTDYLVVGTNNSKRWKFDSYGTKINNALRINESGEKKIRFVQEKQLLSLLESAGLTGG